MLKSAKSYLLNASGIFKGVGITVKTTCLIFYLSKLTTYLQLNKQAVVWVIWPISKRSTKTCGKWLHVGSSGQLTFFSLFHLPGQVRTRRLCFWGFTSIVSFFDFHSYFFQWLFVPSAINSQMLLIVRRWTPKEESQLRWPGNMQVLQHLSIQKDVVEVDLLPLNTTLWNSSQEEFVLLSLLDRGSRMKELVEA